MGSIIKDLVNDNNSMIITQPKSGYNIKYLMGILNSRLISMWFISSFGKLQRRVFPQFKIKELRIFPICRVDFTTPADKTRHDRMVSLVDQMLSAKRHLSSAKTDADKDFYENKCAGLDRQIDALVYELYGLTEDEIKIVEGAAT
ncbi:MAG: hypothetical protein NTX50_23005 [Candidatus Sumerlaeota bacterium]|nr:hypothetical protein [Candidatus Sumerlaeota bacterium]